MGELEVGERLSLTSGTATVTAVRVELLAEPVKVYNFQVADWHTYYAAPEADKPFVWVHNAHCGELGQRRYTHDTFEGRKVYSAGDYELGKPKTVDPKFVDKSIRQKLDDGWTNLDLMKNGNAPIGVDGRPINLHHILGEEPGAMVEILGSTHSKYHGTLHGLVSDGNSFRNNRALKNQYETFRKRYWKWKGTSLAGQ